MTDPQPRTVIPVVPPMAVLPVQSPLERPAGRGQDAMHGPSAYRGGADLTRLRGFVVRLSVVGAILGAVLFLSLFYLIVYILPDVAFGFGPVQTRFGPAMRPFLTILPAAAALAMSVLICFYCGRALHTFRTMPGRPIEDLWRAPAPKGAERRPPLPFLRSDLNKIRMAVTPLLIIFLFGLAVGMGEARGGLTPAGTLVPLGLILGVLGTAWQLIIVRRARWEVARIEGASFSATQARGFTVLPVHVPSPADAAPGTPPVIPLAVAPPLLSAEVVADLEAAEHADAFADWETLVHGVAVLGILLGVLSFPSYIETFRGLWEQLAAPGAPAVTWSMPASPGAPARPIAQSEELFNALRVLAAAIAVGWMVWGVISLCGGPRFRPMVLALIWAGLIVCATVFLVTLAWDNTAGPYRSYAYGTGSFIDFTPICGVGAAGSNPVLSLLVTALFSLIVLLIVSRQAVKNVFAYRPRRVRTR